MTYSPMDSLKEFHDKFLQGGDDRLKQPITIDLLKKRRKLIREEFAETIDDLDYICHVIAFPEDYTDMPEHLGQKFQDFTKELADLLYVIYGTAEELSLPLQETFNAVHESNMDKLWPDGQVHYNEYGKVIKPPTYQPPDLSEIFNASAER